MIEKILKEYMFVKYEEKNFYNVGVNYKKADANIRGRFAISKENQIALLKEAKENGLEEVFVLSTCNRTEIFGLVTCPFRLILLLCKYSKGTFEEFNRVSSMPKGEEAVQHLFRIGTGLDSQILGDYEIVGQLKESFKFAKKQNTTNVFIERLLNSVIQASKRVKNETMLSSGTTSVSYAGVRYITNNLEDYNSKNILVYGLGKMGKHTCLNLVKYTKNKNVKLINRTENRVDNFVKNHPSIIKGNYNNISKEISDTDILIVSTGANTPTVTAENIPKDKELLVFDLSIPANVSPEVKDLPNITLINVDQLSKVTDETLTLRQAEVPKAEAIIDEHKKEFFEWLSHRKLVPAISSFKKSLEKIQQNEINYHKKKVPNFNESQAEAITSKLIQKMTTQFMKHLKSVDTNIDESIQVMGKVFGEIVETSNEKN